MSVRRGNLQPAHRGYRYQDIATAYVLACCIVERYDEVVVDRKIVEDDRIDDLEVRAAGRRVRRQFKSSGDAARPISEDDFVATRSSLRIDRLVLTHVRADPNPADEYRLCATWAAPLPDDDLCDLLAPIAAPPTFATWPAQFFRLRADTIWPDGSAPIWTPLLEFTHAGAEFGRTEFVEFCERFVIELALPVSSTELTLPGPLERFLIDELAERVGIGRYPNQGRVAADVAALAISLANLARTQELSFTPQEIERDLDIRVDFGRVAQAFPVDTALFHDRPAFRQTLLESALVGTHQLIVAPPGSGKSWELTKLADELRDRGAIVARHYCYMEPGDELVERRVTTDVFFGNLLGELCDSEQALRGAGGARYAAGIAEFEASLEKAVAMGRPVVVIVDGIDHIARVRSASLSLAHDDTDIVERLATVNIPKGVALVIGSQPGQHLDPLIERWHAGICTREVPPWTELDIAALADLHGVRAALTAVGISDDGEIERVRTLLAQRTEGNPLYARYLARGLVAGLVDGTVTSAIDWLTEAPAIAGDVATYYEHLYRRASAQAQAIADLLGTIDFSVSGFELREMLGGLLGEWVQPALSQLAPVLTASTGQGGVRIFHESFRRFMTANLVGQGRTPANVLEPAIAWLTQRGFLQDAKAYRFLLPTLRRANRGVEALAHIGATFVSDSVAHAHPREAVQRNITLASDIAARAADWPALVRCVELHRAADMCFDESQNDRRDFWATYVAMAGPTALAERLLFEGRPTLPIPEGLYACSLVDDAGGTAPWSEYLELYSYQRQESSSDDSSDGAGHLTAGEQEALTVVHGRLRLGQRSQIFRRLVRHLRERGDDFRPLMIRSLGARLARMGDAELVSRIATRAESPSPRGTRIRPRAAAVLRLGVADEHVRNGDIEAARESATKALAHADTSELVTECLSLGAPHTSVTQGADPSTIQIAVGPNEYIHDAANLRAWVASVRLIATDTVNGVALIDAERARILGDGWYRCWLRFVLDLAQLDAGRRAGEEGSIHRAFAQLVKDVRPFSGKPRASDLWAIRRVIQESVSWGLTLLRTEDDWRFALESLTTASEGTASRLDREDGGPLPISGLLEVLLPFAADAVGGAAVCRIAEQQLARMERSGSYYPTHAECAMRLARFRLASGDVGGAQQAWSRGAVFFGAYGWHKDATVFDIIESTPALLAVSREAAVRALADAQPLAHAVVAHTDGRTTKQAPNSWLRCLLKVHPAVAIALLARTFTEEDDSDSWPNLQALGNVAEIAAESGDPSILDSILATIRLEVEYEDSATRDADARVAPILRMASGERTFATNLMRRVAAEVTGDGRRYNDKAAARVAQVAAEHGLLIPQLSRTDARAPSIGVSDTGRSARVDQSPLPLMRIPPFPPDATLVDLLTGLRRAGSAGRLDNVAQWTDVASALGYHLGQLIDSGREEDVRRLLRFFARDVYISYSEDVQPLVSIAGALEAAGYDSVAAMAYALSYSKARGGDGWLRMGDQAQGFLMDRAIELDAAAARRTVADEVAYSLRGPSYVGGTSRHIVERLAAWGEPTLAEEAWREAFSVVQHRLPLAPVHGWFATLRIDGEHDWPLVDWSVDEALILLLLARIGNPRLACKVSALAGVVRAIQRRPDGVIKPLRWWLARNASVTSVLLVLDVLRQAEVPAYRITLALSQELQGYVSSPLWGARRLAAQLLERAAVLFVDATYVEDPSAPVGSSQGIRLAAEENDNASQRSVVGITELDEVSTLWPDVGEKVALRLTQLSASEGHRARARSRHQISWGRDGKSFPPTPTLHWDTELLQVAVHEVLCGLRSHLWATGQWAVGLEDELADGILPDTRLHLAFAASRTVRPEWVAAESVVQGTGQLPLAGGEDPRYSGWTRLAFWEHQYLLDAQGYRAEPVERVTVMCGAVAVPLGRSAPPGAFPFREARVDDWWWPQRINTTDIENFPYGPVVGLMRESDWLGSPLVIVPPVSLFSLLTLTPPLFGEPMSWHDSEGAPAVVMRQWWIRNPEEASSEPVMCEGADLIVRPDLHARLRERYGVALTELRHASRRPIPTPGS